MRSIRNRTFPCLVLLMLVALSGQVFAGSTAVGFCAAAGTHYPTIQAAVTAAEALSPPNTVRVCPGVYHEQVVINSPLNLQGIQSTAPPPTEDAVVICPPASVGCADRSEVANGTSPGLAIAAQILVQNPTGVVTISTTVDGKGNGLSCGPDGAVSSSERFGHGEPRCRAQPTAK